MAYLARRHCCFLGSTSVHAEVLYWCSIISGPYLYSFLQHWRCSRTPVKHWLYDYAIVIQYTSTSFFPVDKCMTHCSKICWRPRWFITIHAFHSETYVAKRCLQTEGRKQTFSQKKIHDMCATVRKHIQLRFKKIVMVRNETIVTTM
jgi:hypothetical protein